MTLLDALERECRRKAAALRAADRTRTAAVLDGLAADLAAIAAAETKAARSPAAEAAR